VSKGQAADRDEVLVEKLKELRLEHPFWGYRRMTAWQNHREGLRVNRKRILQVDEGEWPSGREGEA